MFETLKRLYKAGRLTGDMITNAVARGYISQEQSEVPRSFGNGIDYPQKNL